jgi:hypothetical protein
LLAIGVVLTTLAAGQMLDGLREIPQHWWAARTPAPAVQSHLGLSATWFSRRRIA